MVILYKSIFDLFSSQKLNIISLSFMVNISLGYFSLKMLIIFETFLVKFSSLYINSIISPFNIFLFFNNKLVNLSSNEFKLILYSL